MNFDIAFTVFCGFMLLLMAFGFYSTFPSRAERRVNKLRHQVEEARLRNELLRLEGRESEIRTNRNP